MVVPLAPTTDNDELLVVQDAEIASKPESVQPVTAEPLVIVGVATLALTVTASVVTDVLKQPAALRQAKV